MSLSTLKGTRYFAKKRAITLVVLMLLLVSFVAIWSQLAVVNSSTSSAGKTSPSTKAELFTINGDVLLQLVNESDVEFIRSYSNVTYYIVTSAANTRQVHGLVYLTTDVALDWTYGYNSHVSVLVFVNQTGTIESLKPWHMQESWGYVVSDEWLNTVRRSQRLSIHYN